MIPKLPAITGAVSTIQSVALFLQLASMRENLFLHDVQKLRSRVQHRIHDETGRDRGEVENAAVVKLLNDLLATELVCAQRYRRYQFLDADTRHKISVDEIKTHSDQEQQHIALIAERITELGGEPDLSPQGLASTCASYCMDGKVLVDLIKEDIIAECIAMDVYREAIRHLSGRDPTTTDMMLRILQDEEHHTDEMAALLEQLPA